MGTMPTSITVQFDKRDGWWYATSTDLRGLLVASPALTIFTRQIPAVIAGLLKAKYGVDVNVIEAVSPDSSDMRHLTFMAEKKAA